MKKIYVGPDSRLHPDDETGTKEQPYSADFLQSGKDLTGSELIMLPGHIYFSGKVNIFSSDGPLVIRAMKRWETFMNSKDSNQDLIVDATGSNIHFKDLVFQDLSIEDRTITPYDRDTDISGAVFFRGPRQRIDTCIIRNLKLGIGFWSEAKNFVGKGNIIYNIGYYDETSVRKEKTHGHVVYGQTNGQDVSRFEGNVIFAGLNHGLHCYSQSKGKLDNLNIIDSIMFATKHRACLVGGTKAFKNLNFEGNAIYDAGASIGYDVFKQSKNIAINYNQFLECAPTFVNLKDVFLEYNTFVPKNGVVFNTMAPNEAGRFHYDNWHAEGNKVYTRGKDASIGRQVQNGGTKYDNIIHTGEGLAIDQVIADEDFSIYKYVEAGPGLVYFMYYHSMPKEKTTLKFKQHLGDVSVRNVLRPMTELSRGRVAENFAWTFINSEMGDRNSEFLGGNIDDLLPDPKRFGVMVIQQLDKVDEPDTDPGTEDPVPSKDDIRELAMILATAASSLSTAAKDMATAINEHGETLSELTKFLADKYELHEDGTQKE